MFSEKEKEAMRLFRAYTGGTGIIDKLYGPAKAGCRAHILSALTGARVPKSRAGWNVFRSALNDAFGVRGDCIVARDANLQEITALHGMVK